MKNGLRRMLAALMMTGLMTGTGWAQDGGVWIQIEAQPTQGSALARAEDYAERLPDVNGYDLGSGWFGIALGPYSEAEADTFLRQLRSNRAIPADSFLVDGGQFRSQFWPAPGAVAQPSATVEITQAEPEPAPLPEPIIIPAEETLREAQASEAALSRDEKRDLQTALQWAGFYNSTIDGLFGRGTRGSMSAWQEANNFEVTGVLTTGQRTELFRQYNAVLDGLGMAVVTDTTAGIEMQMPTGITALDRYSPPFARYTATGDVAAQVLLISQPGNQDRLFGLYEIMQTLEIVPTDGPRERRSSSFTIEGINDDIHSFTTVQLQDGEIKGFTLVWPAGDEERRTRVLALMQDSYATIPGVLDPALGADEEQSLDLVSGLAIRQPIRARSGFYIDADGTVLTSIEAVQACGEIVLDNSHPATVIHTDAALGLAVLRPSEAIAPLGTVRFETAPVRLQAEVAVAGYPYGGLLSAPSLVFGSVADVRGLNGETEVKRLSVTAQEGDSGGAVFNSSGAVTAMLLPANAGGRVLPADVGFALTASAITASLDGAGITYELAQATAPVTPERLTRAAADVTVLVSCWE